MSNTSLIIILVMLVLFSSFFSMSEISFGNLNKFKLKKEVELNKKGSKLVNKVSDNFSEMISTILVGNNLVNIAASSISVILGTRLFGENGPTISAIIITCVILLFGEILPKLIGGNYPNSISYILVYPLIVISYVLKPITYVVNLFINLLSKLWTPKEKEVTLTDDELIDVVDTIEEDGVFDEDKSDLIRSAIKFNDVTAYDVMIPRVDVIGFDIEDNIEELFKNDIYLEHSYIPVFKENLDNIIGIISTKEIIKLKLIGQKIDLKSLLIEPLYFHETKSLNDVVQEFYSSDIHLAVVVDEFGGTDGILTVENVIEELVGEVFDENDKVVYEYQKINDFEYIINGDMNLIDLFELIEDDYDIETEYSTVNGYLSEVLEKIPEVNDSYQFKNILFTVLEAEDNAATKVKINILLDKEV